MQNAKVKCLCEAAIMLALAQVLSYIKIEPLPSGGSIDLAMVPIIFFCFRYGLAWGTGVGFVYGLMQYFLGNGIAISWTTMIADYLVAYTLLGAGAGFFHGKKGGIYLGTVIGTFLRFLYSFVVGATVWAEYMPEEFLGMAMTNEWVYSFLYNMTWALPDAILCVVAFTLLQRPLRKYFACADLNQA